MFVVGALTINEIAQSLSGCHPFHSLSEIFDTEKIFALLKLPL